MRAVCDFADENSRHTRSAARVLPTQLLGDLPRPLRLAQCHGCAAKPTAC